jgi:hypothetical protein
VTNQWFPTATQDIYHPAEAHRRFDFSLQESENDVIA